MAKHTEGDKNLAPQDLPAAAGEFALIARHFLRPAHAQPAQVALGIGDDCALLSPTPGHQLAVSSDMLVEGRHFFPDVSPVALGHKALAVNLSDLAAMGARPLGFTLALALPEANDAWLTGFSQGLFALADQHGCPLIGGDTTQGPLNICITVLGEVRPGQALRRDGARVGDDVYVSGCVGEARLGLEIRQATDWALKHAPSDQHAHLLARLERPTPRIALGLALAGVANAALDLSDGLMGDLSHVLTASRVGVELHWAEWPVPPALRALPEAYQRECCLGGGDDYELLFTAPASAREAVAEAAATSDTVVHRVGRITEAPGMRLLNADGTVCPWKSRSWDHFA